MASSIGFHGLLPFKPLPPTHRRCFKHNGHLLMVWAAKKKAEVPSLPLRSHNWDNLAQAVMELKDASNKGEAFTQCVKEPLQSKLTCIESTVSFSANLLTIAVTVYSAIHIVLEVFKKEGWIHKADGCALVVVLCGVGYVIYKNFPVVMALIKLLF